MMPTNRQREEADSLEHWEDEAGPSGIRVLRDSPLTLRRKREKMIPEWMERKASAYGYPI